MVSIKDTVDSNTISKASALLNTAGRERNPDGRRATSERVRRTIAPKVRTIDSVPLDFESSVSTGSIALFRVGPSTDLVDEFEAALEAGDVDRLHELSVHLEQSAPEEETSNDERVASLNYGDTEIIDRIEPAGADAVSVGVAPFIGGDIDTSKFEVQEYQTPDSDLEYEYRVLLIPPEQTDAERDADASVDSDDQGAAIETGEATAHAPCLAFAAGVVAVAAAAGGATSQTSPKLEPDTTDDTGPAVDKLISKRQETSI